MPIKRWKAPQAGDLNNDNRKQAREQVVAYLTHFGYMHNDESADLSAALTDLQSHGGLTKTGVFDEATAALMGAPRCGVIDRSFPVHALFEDNIGKWDIDRLSWRFDSVPKQLNEGQTRQALADAFAKWSQISPMNFYEVSADVTPNVLISFVAGNHGGPGEEAFDGPGNVLAHASYPRVRVQVVAHFDADEDWTVEDLTTVALHEFGHNLGLTHSLMQDAIMWSTAQSNPTFGGDDEQRIQNKYGPPRRGWFPGRITEWPVSPPRISIDAGSAIASVSCDQGRMDVFWITADGSVQNAYWSLWGKDWRRHELNGPGSAAVGGITAVSRASYLINVWWVSPSGSVEEAFFSRTYWQQYQLAPPGSAAIGTRIAALALSADSLEVWWVAPYGSIQHARWSTGQKWQISQLAEAGSAAIGGGKYGGEHYTVLPKTSTYGLFKTYANPHASSISGLTAISTKYVKALLFVTPYMRIKVASWNDDESVSFRTVAGNVSTKSNIAAVSRKSTMLEIWWISPDGSVYYLTYDHWIWSRPTLLAPASSACEGGIAAVARDEASISVLFTAPSGWAQHLTVDGRWEWQQTPLLNLGRPVLGAEISVLSRIPGSIHFLYSGSDGWVGWLSWQN